MSIGKKGKLHLVELLRCKICTFVALVPPTDRRRGRISLPLPLRRLRVPRMEPRRRVWSRTDVLTLESGWLNGWMGLSKRQNQGFTKPKGNNLEGLA